MPRIRWRWSLISITQPTLTRVNETKNKLRIWKLWWTFKREWIINKFSNFNPSSRVIYIDNNSKIWLLQTLGMCLTSLLIFEKIWPLVAVTMEAELRSQPSLHHSSAGFAVTMEAELQSQLTITPQLIVHFII